MQIKNIYFSLIILNNFSIKKNDKKIQNDHFYINKEKKNLKKKEENKEIKKNIKK